MPKLLIATLLLSLSSSALGEDLYRPGGWPAFASDRRPDSVGDILTIIVSESAQASNSVRKNSRKRTTVDGTLTAGNSLERSGEGSLGGEFDGGGGNTRSDRVVAQLSATVFQLMPNGDLRISGMQRLHINGEHTVIKISGRVRRDDIAADNTVLSSRIADAEIEYNGKGFTSRSARPSIINEIFSLLGLM